MRVTRCRIPEGVVAHSRSGVGVLNKRETDKSPSRCTAPHAAVPSRVSSSATELDTVPV
jgi:hypothetical protein